MFSQTRSLTRSPSQSSLRTTTATLDHTASISGPSRKISRKPVFQVFCDDDIQEAIPRAEPSNPRALKSGDTLQTVVNNKENQIPELNNRTISTSRQATRSSTRSRVLGEKTPLASAYVNCVEKWDSDIPFAACSSSSRKSVHPIKTQQNKARVSSNSQPPKESRKKSKIPASQSRPAKRLSSHIYRPSIDNTSQPSTNAQAVDDGLIELLSKLEALQAKDDEAFEILDPLPPNATCPGAPKIPSAFTMPLFIADDGPCDYDQLMELKSSNSHHMSPLAEVTEAFTGLQGGWSPPLETLSPALQTQTREVVLIKSDQPRLS